MAMQGFADARNQAMNAEDTATDTPEPQAEAQSEVICIAAQPDGSFLVYEEGEQGEQQQAGSIDEALTMAKQLLQGDSDTQDAQAYWNELAAKKDDARSMM